MDTERIIVSAAVVAALLCIAILTCFLCSRKTAKVDTTSVCQDALVVVTSRK